MWGFGGCRRAGRRLRAVRRVAREPRPRHARAGARSRAARHRRDASGAGDRRAQPLVRRPARHRHASRARALNKVVPGPLVVHARRDRALRFVVLVLTGVVPHLLLRPESTSGHVPRQLRAAATATHMSEAYQSVDPPQLRRARRAGDAPDPPLGGAAVPRRDRRPPVPHLLHRRVPQATRDQLDHRRDAAAPRLVNGFTGYSLPDDLLSGTGLRIAYSIVLSIPIVGTWMAFLVFGGEFPARDILRRLFVIHILLVPLAILGAAHRPPGDPLAPEAHAVPRPRARGAQRRRVEAVADVRDEERRPVRARRRRARAARRARRRSTRSGSTARSTPARSRTAAQPDWYIGWIEGALRLFPPWLLHIGPLQHLRDVLARDRAARAHVRGCCTCGRSSRRASPTTTREHHLLDRPSDRPVRTAIGVGVLTFYVVLSSPAARTSSPRSSASTSRWCRNSLRVLALRAAAARRRCSRMEVLPRPARPPASMPNAKPKPNRRSPPTKPRSLPNRPTGHPPPHRRSRHRRHQLPRRPRADVRAQQRDVLLVVAAMTPRPSHGSEIGVPARRDEVGLPTAHLPRFLSVEHG